MVENDAITGITNFCWYYLVACTSNFVGGMLINLCRLLIAEVFDMGVKESYAGGLNAHLIRR